MASQKTTLTLKDEREERTRSCVELGQTGSIWGEKHREMG